MTKVRIYACGGTGTAIGHKIETMKSVKGAAIPKVVYLDTSDSDMLNGFEKKDKYLLSNVQGAGKLQLEHAPAIRTAIPEILAKFEPGELNIIIASASGGSGSVYTTELANELVAAGKPTIINLVVTCEDSRATQNSINTFKRLNVAAHKKDLPFVVNVVYQSKASMEREIDDKVMQNVSAMLIMGSGENTGLDARDIANFCFFNRVTDVAPRILQLGVLSGEVTGEDGSDSVVTLLELTPKDGVPCDIEALYRATGESNSAHRMLLYTTAGEISEVIDSLKAHKKRIDQRLDALSTPAIEIDDAEEDDLFS